MEIRIALDLDGCISDFWNAYCTYFKSDKNPNCLKEHIITRNVERVLKHDRKFWTGLKVKNTIDFVPEMYCSKRVNPKRWSKEWLKKNNFPDRPFYQMMYQHGNKADMIKGRADVLIDDSYGNVEKCIKSGFPALWYKEHRSPNDPPFTIYSLTKSEITSTFINVYKQ